MTGSADWYENWLRTGALPDGRRPLSIVLYPDRQFACFDPESLVRSKEGKEVPWPDEGPASDGYVTPWERI